MINIDKNIVLKHYSRTEVQEEIVRVSKDKEVVGSYGGKGYAKRPDTLMYKGDVMELVKQGITSFHFSEETWTNPLAIDSLAKKREIEEIRRGWDLILDIDCKDLGYSGLAAHLLISALKHHNIESVSVKFSGNHGYHIGVPFEAFPKRINNQDTRTLFPEAPRRIAEYLKDMIHHHLKQMMEKDSLEVIKEKSGKDDIMTNGEFDPFKVLEIDTILISSRHLLRHVYSFNEKSGLVSIPINAEDVLTFSKEKAKPENINNFSIKFLDRSIAKDNEAKKLFVQAYDYLPQIEDEYDEIAKSKKEYDIPEEAIPEELFPPCIQKILGGLEDGRKRGMFIIINFLNSAGWSHEMIEGRLERWNKANPEPLKEGLLKGQIKYLKENKKVILPPNCINTYYKDLQICYPDNLCNMIRNPIQYARRKTLYKDKKPKKRKKKNEPGIVEFN